eukprot:Skav215845  [mRNA]  locus=scaffold1630:133564:135915:- [translate_table: standard]
MILVMVSFTLMAVLTLNQHVVLSVEQAIETDIRDNADFAFNEYMGHKTLQDVHSIADFWSWMRLGFLPLVIQPNWIYSEHRAEDVASAFDLNTVPNSVWDMDGYQIPVTGDYLHYNRIIGGLRFRQQVAPEAPCKFPSSREAQLWQRWYSKECVPAYEEMNFEPDSSNGEVFIGSARQEWLLLSMDRQRMLDQILDMEDGCHSTSGANSGATRACYCEWCSSQAPAFVPWITERTQRIEVGMATFNPEYGLLTLTGVNLWFARGGRMRKRVELMSVWVNFSQFTAANVPVMVFAGIWLLCLLYIFINEIIEIVSVIRNAESRWHRALIEDYLGFWNIVDWLSISVAAAVIAFWLSLAMQTGNLQSKLDQMANNPSASVDQVATFYDALETTSAEEKNFRLVMCFYPMLLLLRLFKSFAAQPRLAVVTDTIKLAYQDLLHFGLVSVAVIACLCLNAVLLFGRDVEAFGNLPRALHSSFRMLFGDWDWGPMEEVSRSGAYLWFTMFMVLCTIILLNMLLAIILDNYMDVKRVSASAQSLTEQFHEMRRRRQMLKRKERMRLTDVWDHFVSEAQGRPKLALTDEREITVDILQQMGMPRSQAARTLQSSWFAHLKATTVPFELKHSAEWLTRFEVDTRKMRNALYFLFDRLDFYDTRFAKLDVEDFSDATQNDMAQEIAVQMYRLNSEAAEKLAQLLSAADKTQSRTEEKQGAIHDTVRDLTHLLLKLQSLGTQIGTQLEGLSHKTGQSSWMTWFEQEKCHGDGLIPGLPGLFHGFPVFRRKMGAI